MRRGDGKCKSGIQRVPVFSCDGVPDLLRAYPKGERSKLPVAQIKRDRADRGQSPRMQREFLARSQSLANAIKESGKLVAILVVRADIALQQ